MLHSSGLHRVEEKLILYPCAGILKEIKRRGVKAARFEILERMPRKMEYFHGCCAVFTALDVKLYRSRGIDPINEMKKCRNGLHVTVAHGFHGWKAIPRERWTTAHDGVNGSLSGTVTERWPCRKIYLWEIKFDVAVAINGSYKPAW